MRSHGFTLVEIFVVIAIIGSWMATVAIIVPKMQEKQKRLQREAALAERSDYYPTSDSHGSWKLIEPDVGNDSHGLYEVSVSSGRIYLYKSPAGVSITYVTK